MASTFQRPLADNEAPYTDREIIRPPTYYGEGPFSAGSSDSSEEGDALLMEKPGPVALEDAIRPQPPSKRPTSVRFLVITLGCLVSIACLIGVFAAHTYVSSSVYGVRFNGGLRKITLDDVFNGTFAVSRTSLEWVPEAGDGVFSAIQDGKINLVDLKSNKTSALLSLSDITDENGNVLEVASWSLSSDMKYILVKTDYVKQWRHSSFGNYYVHNLETKETNPLIPPSYPPITAYAAWSPTGQGIAYVLSNDLYLLSEIDSTPLRVTTNGSATVFNAVPDWVYEEEVFGTDYALWFSPTSRYVAYLTFDETEVPEYTFPIYNPTENSSTVNPYTSEVVMRYPKPGYNNPLVAIWIVDTEEEGRTWELTWDERHKEDDSIIFDVTWVDDEKLIVKEVNRNADDGNVIYFDFTSGDASQGTLTRKLGKDGEEGDDGWIESSQSIYTLPDSSGYLDLVPTKEGFYHIALYSPVNATEPVFLTSGAWEVTSGVIGVDGKNAYFVAANPLSTGRQVYSVALPVDGVAPTGEIVPLTDVEEDSGMAYYNADFSPEAGFLLLSYEGPDVPWQRVLEIGNNDFEYVLNTNDALANATQEYEAATIMYTTIDIDGYELNVKEMRPPHFDDSGRTKYAVIFRVYGGPGSQTVDLRFTKGFDDYVVCSLQYILVIVDGRGTGFKGRELRNTVKSNLGFWETHDQIEAAKIWAAKDYVDNRRIGIWGWSYGGFMASKVAEADAGVHTLAMSVAPVTSWRLYDSIYTERYMNLPEVNEGGYVNASISSVEGFKNIDFALAHGSGDDNVHFSNSAHLLDMFTQNNVRDYRFRMFTDSDHSITKRGGNREVYEYLASFLVEKWRKGGRNRGW